MIFHLAGHVFLFQEIWLYLLLTFSRRLIQESETNRSILAYIMHMAFVFVLVYTNRKVSSGGKNTSRHMNDYQITCITKLIRSCIFDHDGDFGAEVGWNFINCAACSI